MIFPYDDSVSLKHTCYNCIGESFLKAELFRLGIKKKCAYCGKVAKGYALGLIADRIEEAFETFYVRTDEDMDGYEYRMHNDPEIEYEWEREGDTVTDAIAIALMAENEIAEDIQYVLEEKFTDYGHDHDFGETEFASESYYTTKSLSDESWRLEWEQFAESLRSANRYFNQAGARHLNQVFSGIEQQKTFDHRPIAVQVGPEQAITSLFRARVFQSDEKLSEALKHPAQHLGPPPSAFANNGRMNARGISVFYGAVDEATALAEVRPPVGSQVAVANFTILRTLKLLDLTALGDIKPDGSIFDPAYARELERSIFLGNLTEKLTRPVMPDDEIFEYLPTQAIADFLATEPAFNFDGIIFPSAQVEGGKANVVLFHKASRVEEIVLPPGTDSNVRLENFDGDLVYPDYQVTEWVKDPLPDKDVERKAAAFEDRYGFAPFVYDPDLRTVSLKIDISSLTVHVVKSVKINSDSHVVSRNRYAEKDITDD